MLPVEQTVVNICTISHCVFIYTGYKYIVAFWVMTSCMLGSGYQHSGNAYCLCCQNRSLKMEAADSYAATVNTRLHSDITRKTITLIFIIMCKDIKTCLSDSLILKLRSIDTAGKKGVEKGKDIMATFNILFSWYFYGQHQANHK